jgi:hypothetical protein
MDREKFIELQAYSIDEIFALTSGAEDSRDRFRQLAIETYDSLISEGAAAPGPFEPSPESAANPIHENRVGWAKRNSGSRVKLAPELIRRWESWSREYFEIRARNPQLELRDMMWDISECHAGSSWPYGYEGRIQDWVDAGDPSAPPPFDDRRGIVTPEFFGRLRALRRLCGGWLYWNDELKRTVFAPEPEWQRVRSAREAAKAKQRNR